MKDSQKTLSYLVPPLLLFAASFILCMHWFLLMADTLAAGITTPVIPAPVLASISGYYTIVFGPMTWLIKVVILLLFASMTLQLTIKAIPAILRWTVFLTNAPFVVNGVFHIIPMADKFITNTATPEVQSQYARSIHSAHVASAYAAVLMIVLQIVIIILLQRHGANQQESVS
jgi:hypothetical protein